MPAMMCRMVVARPVHFRFGYFKHPFVVHLHEQGRSLELAQEVWCYSDLHNGLPLPEAVMHPVAVDPEPLLR